jgi:Zn-dependent peptidase ImmA (M78 family)
MPSPKQIEKVARETLTRHGAVEVPVDVEAIANSAGLRVVRRPMESNTSGLLVRDDGSAVIGVNAANHPRRQRFTIAHEMGHFLLHEGRPLLVDSTVRVNKRDGLSSMATNREEIEANSFAAHLLMPSESVYAAVAEASAGISRDPEELVVALARRFEVSEQAMSFRLHNLGITT